MSRSSKTAECPPELIVLYDGECPFCNAYVRMLRLREAVGRVELVNARSDSAYRREVVRQGLELDEGMAALFGGRWYHGAEAMSLLSAMSTRSGIFNGLAARILKSPGRAAMLYPALRACRNLTLRLLGRRKIGDAASNVANG